MSIYCGLQGCSEMGELSHLLTACWKSLSVSVSFVLVLSPYEHLVVENRVTEELQSSNCEWL